MNSLAEPSSRMVVTPRGQAARFRRAALLGGAVLSLPVWLLSAAPASAQSVQELKAQLNMLQRRIEQLETEQKRAARRDAEAQRQARLAGQEEARSARTAQVPPVGPGTPAPVATAQAPSAGRQPASEHAPAAQFPMAQSGTGTLAASQGRGGPGQPQPAPATTPSRQANDQAPPQVASALPVQEQAANDPLSQWRGSFPGSFRVPGTDTSVRLYGFAKLNMIEDLGPRNRSDALSSGIPLDHGAGGGRTNGDFQASARRSRLGIETRTPFSREFGEVRTQLEFDFAGQTNDLTTQATNNSYTPRLRQAFAEFGNFEAGGWGTVLVGQSNSLFNDNVLIPLQWLNDWTPLGGSGVRQAQLRYTHRFAGGLTTSIALENSYSDVTSTSGTSYPDSNGGAGFGISEAPDLAAQAIYQGDWGFTALRGVVREVRIDNGVASSAASRYNDTTVGYGLGFTGALNLLDKRLVLASTVNFGKGLGRYLNSSSNGYGAVTDFGLNGISGAQAKIDAVQVLSGIVGAQYHWSDKWRTNAMLHGVRLNYPSYVHDFAGCAGASSGTVCDGVNRDIWASVINLIYSPVKPIDLGIEYVHEERRLETRDVNGTRGGQADRIQASAIVRF